MSSTKRVLLQRRFAEEMIGHAMAENPNESCGLLAGAVGRIEKFFPVANALHSPVRYEMEPREQLAIMQAMDEKGWELLGIFHSHPNSPAYPSPTDLELAYYSDCLYFIASLANPEKPVLRVFRIDGKKIDEEELVLE